MTRILHIVVLSSFCLFALSCKKDNPTQPPATGPTLVAYYPFNGNANDESGNGNNGTVNGATLTTDRFGHANRAYSFDGQSNEVQVPHSDALNITGDITLSAWFSSTEAPSFRTSHTILTKRLPNTTPAMAGNFPYLICINYQYGIPADYRKPLFASAVYPTYQYLQSTSDVNIVVWNHMVVVVRSSNLRIFLNGRAIKDTTCNNQLRVGNTAPLLIGSGARTDKPAEQFKGKIDDIRIYNGALTDSEIQALYHEGGWTGNHDLVAYYPFNGNADDSSGGGHHGVVYGAVLAADRFGNANAAYSFDGSTSYIEIPGTDGWNFTTGFTLVAWANFSVNNLDAGILAKHNAGFFNGYLLNVFNNHFCFYVNSDPRITAPYTSMDGSWHMIMGVYDGTTAYLYVDGVLMGSLTESLTNTNAANIMIGKVSGGYFFNGKADDIRIYNRPLSPADVDSLYHLGGWL